MNTIQKAIHDNDSISGNLEIMGDVEYDLPVIFMNKNDTTVTPNCTGTNVYSKILPKYRIGFDLLLNNDFTFAGDSITIIVPGDYISIFNYTMNGSNGDDFSVGVFKNGVRVYHTKTTTFGATNFAGSALTYYFIGLVAGDDISLRVANMTTPGNNDPTFTNINWMMKKEPHLF